MKHYCLSCGTELKEEQLLCPKCGHCSLLDALKESDKGIGGVLTAQQIETNTQWVKYKCGKDGLSGHGFAAEDANAMNDMWQGCEVELTGRDNSKCGPDRMSDGQPIQTKYYKTAKESVLCCFDEGTGMYTYEGQVLEVPSDQYDEAVRIMREKIASGKVNGTTDPDDATKIIKRGSVTYQQAKNIARAGNIDSLLFDAKTQSVTAVSAFGISFAINLGMMLLFKDKNKFNFKEAAQMAFLAGLQNGTITMASGILASQVLRTQFGRNLAAYVQWGAKNGVNVIYQNQLGKELVHKLSKVLFNKGIYGGAAKNAAVKFLRTNTITNLAVFVVVSVPDTYHLLQHQMSGTQYVKNLIVSGSSILGGTIGAVLGSMLGPAGMIGGGLAGGVVFSWASKTIADKIGKDDAEKMYQLIQVALIRLSHDYMIQSDEEFQRCLDYIHSEKALDMRFIRLMYSIGCDTDDDLLRVQVAYERLDYYFYSVVRNRKTVLLGRNQQRVLDAIDALPVDDNLKTTL